MKDRTTNGRKFLSSPAHRVLLTNTQYPQCRVRNAQSPGRRGILDCWGTGRTSHLIWTIRSGTDREVWICLGHRWSRGWRSVLQYDYRATKVCFRLLYASLQKCIRRCTDGVVCGVLPSGDGELDASFAGPIDVDSSQQAPGGS